jgi:HD-like signal output (HDOD) protein
LGETLASEAFFAGLVHGLGRLILMENQADRYRKVCQRAIAEQKPLEEIEREAFGVSHADLAVFMLRLWGMPDGVIDAVTHYNAPWDGRYGKKFSPTVALYIANIQNRVKNPPDRFVTPSLNQDYLESVVRKPHSEA